MHYGDTLNFAYVRNNATYRAWCLTGDAGMLVYFVQPEQLSAIAMNREIGGYNMSGMWSGAMTSTSWQVERSAQMTMSQSSQLFSGTINVDFPISAQFLIGNGAASNAAFQLSGSERISLTDYPTLLVGSFNAPDTISGSWQSGTQGEVDQGYFWFARSFQ